MLYAQKNRTISSRETAARVVVSSRPKTFEERQALRRRKKFRTMEEMYGPDFLRTPNPA